MVFNDAGDCGVSPPFVATSPHGSAVGKQAASTLAPMSGSHRKPVAAVTGARQGIGLGIASALAKAGFDLVLLDVIRDARAESALAQLEATGARVAFIAADLAQVDHREKVADQMMSAFGAMECLVNNAGVQVEVRGDILDVTPAGFDRVMNVNLRGTFFLTQAVAKRMVATPATGPDRPHRSIITVSSINATQPAPDRAEYCFSKTGLSMMSQLFALRLAEAGICTYETRPGIIRSDMTAPAAARYDALIAGGAIPVARWGEPADVGATVAALAVKRQEVV